MLMGTKEIEHDIEFNFDRLVPSTFSPFSPDADLKLLGCDCNCPDCDRRPLGKLFAISGSLKCYNISERKPNEFYQNVLTEICSKYNEFIENKLDKVTVYEVDHEDDYDDEYYITTITTIKFQATYLPQELKEFMQEVKEFRDSKDKSNVFKENAG